MKMKSLVTLPLLAALAFPAAADDRYYAKAIESASPRGAGYISNLIDTIPQFVHGGDNEGKWFTTITLVNFRSTAVTVPVSFLKDGGAAFEVPLAGIGRRSSVDVQIPAGGSATLATDQGSADPLGAGFARITVPCASATECGDVGGFAVFTQKVPGRPDFESVVPLLSSIAGKFVLPFDNTANTATGVAIVAPKFNANDGADRTLRVVARNEAGAVILDQNVTMKANGHESYVLAQRFAALAGIRGTIEYSTQDFVTVLGLRFNSTGPFTSIPPFER